MRSSRQSGAPLSGHKLEVVRTCFRAYCECGWSSCARWERREAYGEWRTHVIDHGGEWESHEEHRRRENRHRRKLKMKEDEVIHVTRRVHLEGENGFSGTIEGGFDFADIAEAFREISDDARDGFQPANASAIRRVEYIFDRAEEPPHA